MPFDLQRIRDELAGATLESPYSPALAVAVVNDCLRDAGLPPPSSREWVELTSGRAAQLSGKTNLRSQQLGLLAHLLATSATLRAATVDSVRAAPPAQAVVKLEEMLQKVAPLTAEMMRSNVFRQEELLRRWAEAWGGAITGETAEVSARRIDQLDYRKTLVEYEKAEKARAEEADKRAAAIKAAEEAAAAARGWRE